MNFPVNVNFNVNNYVEFKVCFHAFSQVRYIDTNKANTESELNLFIKQIRRPTVSRLNIKLSLKVYYMLTFNYRNNPNDFYIL